MQFVLQHKLTDGLEPSNFLKDRGRKGRTGMEEGLLKNEVL